MADERGIWLNGDGPPLYWCEGGFIGTEMECAEWIEMRYQWVKHLPAFWEKARQKRLRNPASVDSILALRLVGPWPWERAAQTTGGAHG